MGTVGQFPVPEPRIAKLGEWATAYHVARLLPELAYTSTRDRAGARNSDTYMRMLVSSLGAWRASAAYKAYEAQATTPETRNFLKALNKAAGAHPSDHPKVAATASSAADSACGIRGRRKQRHVLVFCVFRATQADLKSAIETELTRRGDTCVQVAAPESIDEANAWLEKGFGRPPTASNPPVIIVARDNLSESVDLDGGRPIVVHHDLSWSPVRWQQRMGRIVRASTGFEQPGADDVVAVILDTPVDQRMMSTLRGRKQLTEHVVDSGVRALLEQSLPDPADAGAA